MKILEIVGTISKCPDGHQKFKFLQLYQEDVKMSPKTA